MQIASYSLTSETPCMIVAELSANHKQDLNLALETLAAMKAAGADAVKLQTYTPDSLTLDCDDPMFLANPRGPWRGRRLYELYQEACMPYEWHQTLFERAHELGLICFSSPFDKSGVDLLASLDCPAYKIASFEITDIPLISYAAQQGQPVILSTGTASLADLERAVAACRAVGNHQIMVLKCTSAYPAPIERAHLASLPGLAALLDVVPGLSDHTPGWVAPVVAVTLGARLIEKHFVLDQTLQTPDASFSLDPAEFSEMVKAVRQAESALGQTAWCMTEEMQAGRYYQRSLFVAQDIQAGECFTEQNLRSVRPGLGLPPFHQADILGQKARVSLTKGTPLRWEHLSG